MKVLQPHRAHIVAARSCCMTGSVYYIRWLPLTCARVQE